jgi:hypothetical protein
VLGTAFLAMFALIEAKEDMPSIVGNGRGVFFRHKNGF